MKVEEFKATTVRLFTAEHKARRAGRAPWRRTKPSAPHQAPLTPQGCDFTPTDLGSRSLQPHTAPPRGEANRGGQHQEPHSSYRGGRKASPAGCIRAAGLGAGCRAHPAAPQRGQPFCEPPLSARSAHPLHTHTHTHPRLSLHTGRAAVQPRSPAMLSVCVLAALTRGPPAAPAAASSAPCIGAGAARSVPPRPAAMAPPSGPPWQPRLTGGHRG